MSKFWNIPPWFFPLLFLVCYFSFIFFIRGEISNKELFDTLRNAYTQHGYYVVFSGGILEGNFLLGFYIPGSTMMLLGAAFAREGVLFLPYVLLAGTCGLTIAYCINYIVGKHGWYHVLRKLGVEQGIYIAKDKIEKYGVLAFLIGFFSPGSAAFISTAAGVVNMPFRKFLLFTIISQSMWTMLWGGIAYAFGLPIVEFIMKNFFFVIVGLGIVWLIRKVWK